ncbi:cytochrome P450 [Marinobacter sp. X15-166B]|uniref:cytochrome P450 n=1 Tax=Marinobacter sp. X15-166B TaxID=1897620 RepID=UPI00085CB0E6|nr:cytochrome P450 [Marinobacter sp. X15-166B]OEY66107.1 hypothetical protein BG841_06305 [Marinobacter sp. X15-166B]
MTADLQTCPFSTGSLGARFRPYEQEGMFAFFKEARAQQPVFYNQELDCWVVTKKADIQAIFRDPDRFSASNSQSPVNAYSADVHEILVDGEFTREPTQANTDRPKHTRIRNIAGQFLNQKRFARYEDQIRELTRQQIATLPPTGTVDLVEALTYELPAKVLFLLVGVPQEESYRVKRWSDNTFNMIWGKPTEDDTIAGARGLVEYYDFCKSVVNDRLESGVEGDDYVSHLLRARNGDDAILTMNEIYSLVHGVLAAGHETTSNGSANLLWALLSDREQWDKLVADRSLIANAVEEGLRYMTPFITWRRMTLTDVEIGGVAIPAGATILMSLVSANHDEDSFEGPLAFDVERKNARQHLAFGNGIHFCMGAPLARMEMKILLEELTQRYPNMRLVEKDNIEWPLNMGFRGPVKLLVELGE